jgi:hypothetical protein
MFFVAKEKIGTTLGSQKEYTAATRRGIGFVSHGNVWHYLWPADMLERSIRAQFEPHLRGEEQPAHDEDTAHGHIVDQQFRRITHYIWSQEVQPGEIIGEPVINPLSSEDGDWISEAKRQFLAAQAQRRAAETH